MFVSAPNKFHALTSHDEVYVHGPLQALAANLDIHLALKIPKDKSSDRVFKTCTPATLFPF